jgi:hypothetical protein
MCDLDPFREIFASANKSTWRQWHMYVFVKEVLQFLYIE